MGRRGPPKKPTHLRVLEGNPSRRPLPENEPKPRPITPRCPSWLDKEAKKEFRRAVKILAHVKGLLTEADGTAMAIYASAYSQWKTADQWIQKHGTTYLIRGEDGNPKYMQVAPQVSIRHKAWEQVRRLCQEFGMTPSARGQISLPGVAEEDDPMEGLLRQGGG